MKAANDGLESAGTGEIEMGANDDEFNKMNGRGEVDLRYVNVFPKFNLNRLGRAKPCRPLDNR